MPIIIQFHDYQKTTAAYLQPKKPNITHFPLFKNLPPVLGTMVPQFGSSSKVNIAAPFDIKIAWQIPFVKRAAESVILEDLFRESPTVGSQFIQKINELTQNPKLSSPEILKSLRQFFLSVSFLPEIQRSFELHKFQRIERRVAQCETLLKQSIQESTTHVTPQNLLDIGCGDGLITEGLGKKFGLNSNNTIGAEILPLKECPPGMTVVLTNGVNLPIGNNVLDLVLTLSVLHHAEDFKPLLKEVLRVLKPGGTFLVREFHAPDAPTQQFNLMMDYLYYHVFSDDPEVPQPGHFFSEDKWCQIFKESGFEIQKIHHPESFAMNPYQPFVAILKKPLI
ncbi:MAG: class I SAM-dependent methyltransferase [Cyanobacteria bacterium]|nr:class I SAM-dependent methyltransferase [Cyanobacteriota bacterium]